MIFTVDGTPVSQGSHKAFVIGGKARITDAKKGLMPWRKKVADAAREAWGDKPLLEGPVQVRARFLFPRPKSHYGTGRNADALKPSAPRLVTGHHLGDLDKHLRSIFDALTGVVFKDDCQVAVAEAWKAYGAHPHCIVEVTPL